MDDMNIIYISLQPDARVGWSGVGIVDGVRHYGIAKMEFASIEEARKSAINWAHSRGILDLTVEILGI
jgi:hypothetical protein